MSDEPKPMSPGIQSKLFAVSAIAAMGGMGKGDIMFGRSGYKEPNKPRPCVNCKKPHTHNNSFCSAECCKEHRAKKS